MCNSFLRSSELGGVCIRRRRYEGADEVVEACWEADDGVGRMKIRQRSKTSDSGEAAQVIGFPFASGSIFSRYNDQLT